jgi:phosphoserine phosphatase RsbU/P
MRDIHDDLYQPESALDMINSTVTRMSDLIDNILDFARGRLGGGITLNRDANRPLEPVLEQVVDELRTASPQRLIETSFEIADPVNCDRTRIGQLASNLIGNALTHGARDQAVRVGAKTEGDEFTLWVANAGEPIPEPAMERLFEPFEVTFATAARVSDWDFILPRRSLRRTAGASR